MSVLPASNVLFSTQRHEDTKLILTAEAQRTWIRAEPIKKTITGIRFFDKYLF